MQTQLIQTRKCLKLCVYSESFKFSVNKRLNNPINHKYSNGISYHCMAWLDHLLTTGRRSLVTCEASPQ